MVRSRGGRDRNGTDAARAEPRVLPSVLLPGPLGAHSGSGSSGLCVGSTGLSPGKRRTASH